MREPNPSRNSPMSILESRKQVYKLVKYTDLEQKRRKLSEERDKAVAETIAMALDCGVRKKM